MFRNVLKCLNGTRIKALWIPYINAVESQFYRSIVSTIPQMVSLLNQGADIIFSSASERRRSMSFPRILWQCSEVLKLPISSRYRPSSMNSMSASLSSSSSMIYLSCSYLLIIVLVNKQFTILIYLLLLSQYLFFLPPRKEEDRCRSFGFFGSIPTP